MVIKTVEFRSRFSPGIKNDCAVLRVWDRESQHIEISFPFHEDTPNFNLTASEAMDLRNAIDELLNVKFIEAPRSEVL